VCGGWIAGVIALWGVLAAVLDVDPIADDRAPALVGPILVVASALAVLLVLLRTAVSPRPALDVLAGLAGCYLAMIVSGGVAYAIGAGDAAAGILFLADRATSPFTIGASVLTVPCVLLVTIVAVRARRTDGDRPSFARPDDRD
jgi:hypothetical protein